MTSVARRWPRWLRSVLWLAALAILGIGLWGARTTVNVSSRIQALAEEQFEAHAGGKLRIGGVAWHWRYVDFTDVIAEAPLLPGRVAVSRVRVHLTLLHALLHRLQPLAAVGRVDLVAPDLVLSDALVQWIANVRSRPPSTFSARLPDIVIALGEGSIHYQTDEALPPAPLATGLAGRVHLSSSDRIVLDISGQALSDTVNFALNGSIGVNGAPSRLSLIASRMNLSRMREFVVPQVGGSADVRLTLSDSLSAALALDGVTLVTANSRNARKGIRIGPVSMNLTVAGQEARWGMTEVPVEGLTFATNGALRWKDALSVDAVCRWSGEVNRLGELISPALADMHGVLRGEMKVSGPVNRPTMSLDLASDSLVSAWATVRNVSVRCRAEENPGSRSDPFVISALSMNLDGTRFVGSGSGRIDPLDIRLQLAASPLVMESIPPLVRAGVRGRAHATAQIRISDAGVGARLTINEINVAWNDTPVPLATVAVTRDTTGRIELLARGRAVSFDGQIVKETDGERALSGTVRLDDYPLPVGGLASAPRLNGELAIRGNRTLLTAVGQVQVATTGRPAFPVSVSGRYGSADGTEPTPLSFRLSTPALPFANLNPDVDLTLTRQPEGWELRGRAWGDRLTFLGHVEGSSAFRGVLRAENVPVPPLANIVHLGSFMTDGTLSGQLEVAAGRGALRTQKSSFSGNGSFRISAMTMRDLDSLDAEVAVAVNSDSTSWATGPIRRQGRTVAFTSGVYRRDGSLSTRIWGPPDGRLETALALVGSGLNASGNALWSVSIADTRETSLEIGADILATRGQIITIPFDTTRIRLEGDTHWLTLADADLRRTGYYHALCREGKIPINAGPDAELDLPITILPEPNNNVFWLITHLMNMGVTGKGSGSGSIRIAGPASQAVIGDGWCEVRDGTLEWQNRLWPTWKNVQVRASVVPVMRFLKIERFSAHVGDGLVLAGNVPAEEIGADPLTIGPIGLSLGAVQVETPRPIPLHIPGGMPSGESLKAAVSGRERAGKFTITGPWEHPLFVGEIVLSDGYFTYPLEETGTPGDTLSAGEDLLHRINWQVDLVAGRNLYYESRTATENIWRRLLRQPIQLIGSMAVEMEARLNEGGRVELRGIYGDRTPSSSQGSLNVITQGLISEQARMSVLDIDFKPDGPLLISWDTRSDPEPIIRGRGVATLGDSVRIYARLVSIDPQTRVIREGGRFDELTVELDSDEILGDVSQQEKQLAILHMLGYYSGDPQSRQLETRELVNAGYRTLLRRGELRAWRSVFGPFQRQIRRLTRIDVIEVEPSLVLNLLDNTYQPGSQFAYLRGTNWTVGQYVWGNFFLSYHGQLELRSIAQPTLGARHQVGIQWAIRPSTRLELTRDIEVPFGLPDTRVAISHRFTFQSY